MAKSIQLEADVIKSVFAGVAPPLYGEVFLSLHTGNPTENGDQETLEASFGGYVRQQVAIPGGFDVSAGDRASNTGDIIFPVSTGPDQEVTFFAIGLDVSGPGQILYFGLLTTATLIEAGISLKIGEGALLVIED